MSQFFLNFLGNLWQWFQIAIQIGLLATIIYMTLLFLKGTRAEPILVGIVISVLFGWFLSQLLGLEVIEWILTKLPALMALAVLIIFQPEIRRAFAEIGINPHRLIRSDKKATETIDCLITASYHLAEKNIGGLIAVERDIGMRTYTDAGVAINAPVSSELLITLFYPNTPLHDGAAVIRNGMLISAACFFPLTQTKLSRTLGTRHRAGIGITEETDAIVIIISEEDGGVSLANKGRLVRNIEKRRMRRHLTNFLIKNKTNIKTHSEPSSAKTRFSSVRKIIMNLFKKEGISES